MKNPNAILPKPQELNESIRKPEKIGALPQAKIMLEPKFDGSFIYITQDAVTKQTVICTKDGNELCLEPEVQIFLQRTFAPLTQTHVLEAELEPVPWTEESKVKLNGNLYSGATMPFGIRVVVHDALPLTEVHKGTTAAIDRYHQLCMMVGAQPEETTTVPFEFARQGKVSACITPCQMVSPKEAQLLFEEGWNQGKATKRIYFGGAPYEGLVGIKPQSVHQSGRSNKWKFKPFHSVDIQVISFNSRHTGKVQTYEVCGRDTKTGESVRICTGISPEMFAQIEDAAQDYETVILEVEALAIKNLAHGNPTLKAVRWDKMTPKPGVSPTLA